jgi:shikimate kinase
MGSGKSTIGPLLAKELHYTFVDLDGEIARRQGMTIQEIFADKGETYFRQEETSALEEYAQQNRQIIALGGGALIRSENYIISRTTGILVYLAVTPEEIYRRISGKPGRPLLENNKAKEDYIKEIQQLMKKRMPGYRRAEIKVKTDARTPHDVVRRILIDLRGRNLISK